MNFRSCCSVKKSRCVETSRLTQFGISGSEINFGKQAVASELKQLGKGIGIGMVGGTFLDRHSVYR
jgi:hypothetical protein